MKYGLNVSKCLSLLKIVNSEAQFVVSKTYNVSVTLDSRFTQTNVMVIHLDNFDLIQGINFC